MKHLAFVIAKKGKDVELITDPNDAIFHSDFNTFKIISQATKTVTLAASTSNQVFTQAHGQSFIPLPSAFAKDQAKSQVFLPNSDDLFVWGSKVGFSSTGVRFNSVKCDATNIIFNFNNTDSSPHTIDIRYFLLESIDSVPLTPGNTQEKFFGMQVAKDDIDVTNVSDPSQVKFSSKYGTLKYFTKQAKSISFDASTLDISAKGQYAHNLGYYPYCETYVSVDSGPYEYCPFFGSGATIAYNAHVIIDKTNISVYGEINGVSSTVWTFDFLIFVFKNDLKL